MKAVQINKYGGVEVLEINEVEEPKAGPNQVLVEVYAACINPFDYHFRFGAVSKMMPVKFPATMGGDFAGKIIELGEGVSDFKAGDEVFGSAIILGGGSGSFAQKLVANTANIALKPTSVDFTNAAALPLVGSSAIQAIEEHIKLKSGQKILIHGGAGGIGHVAVQVAKALGAYVAVTAASKDVEFVKSLGADQVINYQKEDFSQDLKDFDAVYDTVGGEVTNKSFKVLKKGGVIVSMLGQPDEQLVKEYGVTAIGQGTKTTQEHLERLKELVDGGKVKVHVDKVFTLDQIKEAFTYQEQTHPRGKVVIRIKTDGVLSNTTNRL